MRRARQNSSTSCSSAGRLTFGSTGSNLGTATSCERKKPRPCRDEALPRGTTPLDGCRRPLVSRCHGRSRPLLLGAKACGDAVRSGGSGRMFGGSRRRAPTIPGSLGAEGLLLLVPVLACERIV